MKSCNKCGYQNNDESKICANCFIDLRWASANLGNFTGTVDDTMRIGNEERKRRGIKDSADYLSQKKEEQENTNTFIKAAAISLVVGMLAASLGVALMDIQFGLDVAINSFFKVLPRSLILGGLPSMILVTIVLLAWKGFGKSGKSMTLASLIIGLIIGCLCSGILYISYGI